MTNDIINISYDSEWNKELHLSMSTACIECCFCRKYSKNSTGFYCNNTCKPLCKFRQHYER